jgi:hypothetical protein
MARPMEDASLNGSNCRNMDMIYSAYINMLPVKCHEMKTNHDRPRHKAP